MFQELYNLMEEEFKRARYDYKRSEYEHALNMSAYEKKISFLNRYFVYKKIAHVNAEKVSIELMEEFMNEGKEKKDKKGKTITEKMKSKKPLKGTTKPKVKKLTQMLVLEDNEDTIVEEEKVLEEILQPLPQVEEEKVAPVKKPRKPYTKKLVIGKDTDIKDIENIEEQSAKPKKVKNKNVSIVIEE
jgi:hypothetical protein